MTKHHIAQEAYLNQWTRKEWGNKFCAFDLVLKKEYPSCDGGSKFFYKSNYYKIDTKEMPAIVDENEIEKYTADIERRAISIIRYIKKDMPGLNNEERVVVAHYVALQYYKSPNLRGALNSLLTETLKEIVLPEIKEKFRIISKEEILEEAIKDGLSLEEINKIKEKNEDVLRQELVDYCDQSKESLQYDFSQNTLASQTLKTNDLAKNIFYRKWVFLIAPPKTSFATSDTPLSVIAKNNFSSGPANLNNVLLMPLRPDICLLILEGQAKIEIKNISREKVRELNRAIASFARKVVVFRDIPQMQRITKNLDLTNHKEVEETKVYKKGDYIIFNKEGNN